MNENGFINLRNGRAECKLALWGANLLSYRPAGQKHDVFWLGDRNKFDHAQAIRGGIPVCWPRFAAEALNGELPRHGFARICDWKVENIITDEQQIAAEFSLPAQPQYNLPISATLRLKIADELEYTLETTNLGEQEFCFSEALHCYFNISSLENLVIKGLNRRKYKNSLTGEICALANDLRIHDEFDAVFAGHDGAVQIVDSGFGRIINLSKSGSNSTVVWNPGKDLAEMAPGQYKNFVCVEPANQGACFVRLQPEQTHRIAMTLQVEEL